MSKKEIVLFVVFNEAFYDVLTVWVDSFVRHGNVEPEKYDLILFANSDVKEEEVSKRVSVPYTLIKLEGCDYSHQKSPDNHMHNDGYIKTSALRLDAIDYLRGKYRTGVYFDIDALICGDVSSMFNHLPKNKKIKATLDYPTAGFRIKNNIPLTAPKYVKINNRYFNNGVMVLNFDALDEDLAPLFVSYDGDTTTFEQDFMNSYFKPEEIKIMSYGLNCRASPDLLGTSETMIESIRRLSSQAPVRHYVSGMKPWARIDRWCGYTGVTGMEEVALYCNDYEAYLSAIEHVRENVEESFYVQCKKTVENQKKYRESLKESIIKEITWRNASEKHSGV